MLKSGARVSRPRCVEASRMRGHWPGGVGSAVISIIRAAIIISGPTTRPSVAPINHIGIKSIAERSHATNPVPHHGRFWQSGHSPRHHGRHVLTVEVESCWRDDPTKKKSDRYSQDLRTGRGEEQ